MPQKIALITGATGVVGPAIAWALHAEGYGIRTFSRTRPVAGLLPPETDVFLGDITDLEAVASATRGAGLLIHLASLLHINAPPESLSETYHRVNVEGTANVMTAAARAGTERVLFFSTIAVYGDSADKLVDEESATNPKTIYARTKLDAEAIVLSSRRANGKPLGTVLRLAAVYGGRLKGNYRRLVLSLARHRFIPIGPGGNRRTLAYHRDVAAATVIAAKHPEAAGRIYNVTDGQVHTLDEIISAICQALGRPRPQLSLPIGLARFAAAALEDSARVVGFKSPINREVIHKYTEDIAVNGARLHSELGFTAQFNLASGWQETIADMRRDGEL